MSSHFFFSKILHTYLFCTWNKSSKPYNVTLHDLTLFSLLWLPLPNSSSFGQCFQARLASVWCPQMARPSMPDRFYLMGFMLVIPYLKCTSSRYPRDLSLTSSFCSPTWCALPWKVNVESQSVSHSVLSNSLCNSCGL